MIESTWDVVPYTPELAPAVLALTRRTWGEIEIADAAFHRWQYHDNPAGPAIVALARARSTGAVVGQFGAIPLRVTIDGQPAIGLVTVNAMTDDAWRQRGIFVALARTVGAHLPAAGASFALAVPNPNSWHAFTQRLGYHWLGDIPLLARPVNVQRLLATRLRAPGLRHLAAALPRRLNRPLPAEAAPVAGVTVMPVEHFDASFDAFWERIRPRQGVMVVRDRAYLEWRFQRIPLRRYRCFQATASGALSGYLVVRLADVLGIRAGLIVDFIVEPSPAGARAGRALLTHGLAHFAAADVDLLSGLMLPHAPEYRLLRRAGFFPVPRPLLAQRFPLVILDGPALRDRRHWFLTMGDYDAV